MQPEQENISKKPAWKVGASLRSGTGIPPAIWSVIPHQGVHLLCSLRGEDTRLKSLSKFKGFSVESSIVVLLLL